MNNKNLGGWIATFSRINTKSYIHLKVRDIDEFTAQGQQEEEAISLAINELNSLGDNFVVYKITPIYGRQYELFIQRNKELETTLKYNS